MGIVAVQRVAHVLLVMKVRLAAGLLVLLLFALVLVPVVQRLLVAGGTTVGGGTAGAAGRAAGTAAGTAARMAVAAHGRLANADPGPLLERAPIRLRFAPSRAVH